MELFNKNIDNSQKKAKLIAPPQLLKCKGCGREILDEIIYRNNYTCTYCEYIFRMPAVKRIEDIADKDSFVEIDKNAKSRDPLKFPGYQQKLKKAKAQSGLNEAIICGTCTIGGFKTGLACMDSFFMMGSMGEVVGDKIVNLVEICIKEKMPLIIFCCSGGARMQEGILSLMQMSRTTIAINKLKDAGLLYVSVLTNPTTGGVTASFAMQGDIIISEPKALIGFAGPRVIASTVKDTLPEDFQKAEFLLSKGMIDSIVERNELKTELTKILDLHM